MTPGDALEAHGELHARRPGSAGYFDDYRQRVGPMSAPLPRETDLAPIRACIQSQRPIHWTVAAQLVRELEALRRAHQAPASGDGSTFSPAPAPRSDDAVQGRALSIRRSS